ncbi:MAG: hypothetical protein NZ580_00820 [Bacteroidia bacterium]|nr:hypothetical protein [Bacteroidia bacterium]MDW8235237.1 hypothetical protein [Bacteroidia bacterium]
MRKFLLGSLSSLLIACQKQPQEPLVARYKDRYLTRSEALTRVVLPAGADTALLLRSYGAEWIRQQALADTAYRLLPELRQQIEAQTQEYRTRLLISYLSRLLMEKATQGFELPDSVLSQQYAKQPEAFRASQPYYHFRWVKLPDTWMTHRELRQYLFASDTAWQNWLQQRKYEGAVVSEWVPRSAMDSLQTFFATSLAALPLRGHTQTYRIEKGGAHLLVFQLTGLILPGQVLPFELVREQVRNVLLHQRVHAWLSAFEDTIYARAVAQPDVVLY